MATTRREKKGEAHPAVSWRCQATDHTPGDFMKIDRELQRRLLEAAVDVYPSDTYPEVDDLSWKEQHNLAGQLYYLDEHGLIENHAQISMEGHVMFGAYKATKAGIDFLADDGGLSAVLGVVTVKLHDDTIRSLLIQRIEESEGDATVKGELVKQVRSLPAEALKTLTTRALEAGLRHLPNAIQLLHTWLPHA